jgi:elongation factor G
MADIGTRPTGPRCIALVGPFQSGKTTLLEAILARTGAIPRQGTVETGTTVGDGSKEARHHRMSVELSVATTSFMGESYTFIDCPGSVEFVHDMRAVLPVIDAAVVVCEADEKKVPQLQLILRELEELKVPRFLFLNKIDKTDKRVRETLTILQPASRVPLLLRQIPIWKGDIVSGFTDLALERAFIYREHAPSEVVSLTGEDLDREKEARFSMLETLADHDDELMEQLLEDIPPPRDKVFDDLTKELRNGLVCPVLIGTATRTNGVLRLMKALRHEAPGVAETTTRLDMKIGNDPVAYVLKTFHTGHGGKMSVARVLCGQVGDGTTFQTPEREAGRVAGVFKLVGHETEKRGAATAGEVVAFGKLDHAATGDTLSAGKQMHPALPTLAAYSPVLAIAISAKERKVDVKLGQALHKLMEADPSLTVIHNAEAHEVVVWGQGEMHLRVATERLADLGVAIVTRKPTVGYRETIKKGIVQRGRHKKQSGGHGQFGDVVLDVKPVPRGTGFSFDEKITGGVVPRNYIPSVEEGVIDALKQGPLGFPVVDIAVSLIDGSYHTVDSSDMAFRTAGRIGVVEALPQCQPVLLEPIHQVEIVCPSEATAKINAIMSGRRGQILGFDTRAGWPGWDIVRVQMPEAEIGDLIVEIRSATAGVGTFTFKFDHMAELTGRTADQIVAARKAATAGGTAAQH